MVEVFSNDYHTTLSAGIDDDDTTLIVASVTGRPTGGEFRIIIDPETASAEICTVTSVSTNTFTVTRASEAVAGVQTAFAHNSGAVVSHVITAGSLSRANPSLLYSVKTSVDTPDDEFNSTTIDAKWTVVSGTAGTASLFGNAGGATNAVYDLSTRPGWMLMQTGTTTGNTVQLRQDYTIPDGSSIVVALAIASPSQDASPGPGWADNELQVGITLNTDDTGATAGAAGIDFYAMEVDANSTDVQVVGRGMTSGGTSISTIWRPIGTMIYLRIARTGLVYYPYFSMDGFTWAPMDDVTFASALTNIWIFHRNVATQGTPTGVTAWAWVRLGSNNIDPWIWA
jgi:hypothetical protein